MQIRRAIFAALFLVPAIPSSADMIDDADAKRRGVTVAQVQAENALAREKEKEAALGKQIADLQRQLAVLKANSTSDSSPGLESTGDTKIPGATAPSGVPSSTRRADPAPPWADVKFGGPRGQSKTYAAFVDRYLKGDWATLAADLDAAYKEIAAMPEGNRADLKYIQFTLTECRPEWWEKVEQGKPLQFRQSVFGEEAIVDYEPGDDIGFLGFVNKGNVSSSRMHWPADQMASQGSPPTGFTGLNLVSENGGEFKELRNNFVQADFLNNLIWRLVSSAAVTENSLRFGKISGATDSAQYKRHVDFMGELAAAYYGSPAARRLAILQSNAALDRETVARVSLAPFRPLSAALLIDWKTHPDTYPTLGIGNIATNFKMSDLGKNGEYSGADFMFTSNILRDHLSLVEDRRVREIAKKLADENQDWKISTIKLPNSLIIDLDPMKDNDYFKARLDFLQAPLPQTAPQ